MKYGILVLMFVAVLFSSCSNDDNNGVESVPPRLLAEVATENDEEIREFLQTHFYNYEEFEAPPADFDYKIRIDTIAGDNMDKTPLLDQVTATEIKVSYYEFALSEEETDIPHTLYYLMAKTGAGENPTVADSVFVRYEGTLLDGTKFDASETFLWQELPLTVRGFANGISKIKSGTTDGLIVNTDGSFSYSNSGIGLVIMPSGLAYFSGTGGSGRLPRYANLMFSIELGNYIFETDSDNDGVPSILEDVNGNGYMYDDNTDGNDIFADFQDADDDGDGVSTRNEITDENGEIIFPYPDADNDGIPDYLDPDTK